MPMTIEERFQKLEELASTFKLSHKETAGPAWTGGHQDHVDEELFANWAGEVVEFFDALYGIGSGTSRMFLDKAASDQGWSTWDKFKQAYAIFSQKKANHAEDPSNLRFLAFLTEMDDQLDIAQHFLNRGHQVQAAFTAGIVLELEIKRLCDKQLPPIAKVHPNDKDKTTNHLISELKTCGVYDGSKQDQLISWTKERNAAGHGDKQNGDFNENDLQRMIDGIRDFVAEHKN